MNRIARARDTIVAYLSLLFGAGLSVGANLADTLRIRGHLVDTIDIALAIGPPLAALLVVELFVSAWPRKLSVQSVRWVATLIVGILATIVSWIHIHELLAARGQNPYVAMLWPVAIDGLAIMAMAKLLVTRGHVAMATLLATPMAIPDEDMANLATRFGQTRDRGVFADPMATQPDDPTIDVASELAKWQAGYEQAMTELGQDVANEAEEYLAMAGKPLPSRPVPVIEKVPDAAREFIVNMIRSGAAPAEIDQATAEMQECSIRTARRYRGIVSKHLSKEEN